MYRIGEILAFKAESTGMQRFQGIIFEFCPVLV